jgi:hypothetical protein
VVNAIVDALAPFNISNIDMPVRSEKVWKILNSAERTAGSPQPGKGI